MVADKKEFEKKQAKAVNLEAYKRQMQTIKDSFQTLLQQLPKADQMAELLDEISYAATGAGCEISAASFKEEKDAEFYNFYRSLEAYEKSFSSKSDIMVVKPDSDFFHYLKDGSKDKK